MCVWQQRAKVVNSIAKTKGYYDFLQNYNEAKRVVIDEAIYTFQ